jgi:PAS domain S-box-containing protein
MLSYTRIVGTLGMLGLILSGFFVLVSWRTVSTPLYVLISRIESIAAGRYSERVRAAFSPEFNEIADAFNAMADSIERRDREIQRNEERYRLLFSGNRAPALLVDGSDGCLRDANPAAVAYYGYPNAELSRLRIGDLDIGMEKTVLESMNAAANGEFASVQTRHRLKSGAVRDVELYVGPIEFEERRYLHTIVFDVTQRRLAEERTEAALREKIQLIQEIYHRVKNNQQLVVSLLRMQADSITSAESRKELQIAQERMFAMSLAHDLVYQMDDLSLVEAKGLAQNLAQYYSLNYGDKARPIEVVFESLLLELDKAMPFALILNELIASVVRREGAAVSREALTLKLVVTAQLSGAREVHVSVTVPESQGISVCRELSTLSVLLVSALAGQLRGEASWFSPGSKGTLQAELRFPV